MSPTDVERTRRELGLTQTELARLLGVHRVTVTRWETGIEKPPAMLSLAMEALAARRAQ